MMFSWLFGAKKTDDRLVVLAEVRETISAVEGWDQEYQLEMGVTLTMFWRMFINEYGSGNAFAKLPRQTRQNVMMKYGNAAAKTLQEISNKQHSGKLVESREVAFWATNQLMSYYLLALTAEDKEMEQELSPFLDHLLRQGWILGSAMPLPNDPPFTEQPPVLFTR